MDVKKLESWAQALLDAGKGNALISFKDSKFSSVEVVLPSAEVLFSELMKDAGSVFEVYDPKLATVEDADVSGDEASGESSTSEPETLLDESDAARRRAAYVAQHGAGVRKKNQLLVYNAESNPITTLTHIEKKARVLFEESGVNVAYMAFGFIHWKESESSALVNQAPILLVPIHLERASTISPYRISVLEDDVIVNPTFAYKLESEYGVKLPEYRDEDGLNDYLNTVEEMMNKLSWTVVAECKLGVFSFYKISMYRDLKDHASEILKNKNIRVLLGESSESVSGACSTRAANPLLELSSVMDADSSQIEAIETAKSGESFVLQGPPGTGKSQTIANIIAECLNDGKTVLFVSEKLAALHVVYDKLKQAGLAEFCLELHSHKANKKEVVSEICKTLQQSRASVSSSVAESKISAKRRAQRQLDAYAEELHRRRPALEESLFELYARLSELREVPDVKWRVPQLGSKGGEFLERSTSLLEQYADYAKTLGDDYRQNAWLGYKNESSSAEALESTFDALDDFLHLFRGLQTWNDAAKRYNLVCSKASSMASWRDCFALLSKSSFITPKLLSRAQLASATVAASQLATLGSEILALQSAIEADFEKGVYELDAAECREQLTTNYSGAISRVFHGEYKRLISHLCQFKKENGKLRYEEAVQLTERLLQYRQRMAEYQRLEESADGFFGEGYAGIHTDWRDLSEQLSKLQKAFDAGLSFNTLYGAPYDAFKKSQANFSALSTFLNDLLSKYGAGARAFADSFDVKVVDLLKSSPETALEKGVACSLEKDRLSLWLQFRRLLSELDSLGLLGFIDHALSRHVASSDFADAFKKSFYAQWTDAILSSSTVLSHFSRASQDQAVVDFAQNDKAHFEINKARIRATLSGQRPSRDNVAPGGTLHTLLREGQKKSRLMSVRQLLATTGELVRRIKPCFLTSPLSVSALLAAETNLFDVAIFDEASQIFPQEAAGAIYRAKQVIVVGDSKQMPPTDFFHRTVDSDDVADDVGDVMDFESILSLCAGSMRQLSLRWHYRSRFEQLIAFSNKNFYNGSLITFPSCATDERNARFIGTDYYHVAGVFENGVNRKEAEFVVDLIYKNIEKYPKRSLGVVAFSTKQQDLIEKLLLKRRRQEPAKEFFFNKEVAEPFFIKNLETVQGDERDAVIFSVAYGRNSQGSLRHQFGPLNKSGGERRLNVAVTRAKYNVQLVSSMRYTDIDLSRSTAEGVRLLREYLDFAENGDIGLERSLAVPHGDAGDSEAEEVDVYERCDSAFEIEVYEFLRQHGYYADPQVGCSGFRIDLGLKRSADSSDYVLAIECDGASYHSSRNARDRDRLRQEILERMGWKFYRVWSTEWFRNKAIEQRRLMEAAAAALNAKAPEYEFVLDEPAEESADAQPEELFETAPQRQSKLFPLYRFADIEALKPSSSIYTTPSDRFLEFVKAILEVEAPLSEEWLIKRILSMFDTTRFTTQVRRSFVDKMSACKKYGILRKNGFLYLLDGPEIRLRKPDDVASRRDSDYIAPEELAAGMLAILRENGSIAKKDLFLFLAKTCGFANLGSKIKRNFENAFKTIRAQVVEERGYVSLKEEDEDA